MLPRLVYIGDVPVEASYHGSALLYRLLQQYPPDKLRIIEGGLAASLPERRLKHVDYVAALQPFERLLRSRLHRWIAAWLAYRATQRFGLIDRLLADFVPDAVLTVAHGFSWLTAAEYARRKKLPLHLIVHDDWPNIFLSFARAQRWNEAQFAQVYREAASRLCVSPYMVEEYKQRYGIEGTILYPSRSPEIVEFDAPSIRTSAPGRPLVIAFGGTINTGGHVKALVQLVNALQTIEGQLYLYGPLNNNQAQQVGLMRPNVKLQGLVPSADFIKRLRDEADVLFVPMSFEPRDQHNMRLLFPSKLTDYTAAGLPLLVYGPPDSSAVRWAQEYPDVAEVVTSEVGTHLADAVGRLLDSQHRLALAREALAVGNRMFAHSAVCEIFYDALLKAAPLCQP